jgi:hypothetical protein
MMKIGFGIWGSVGFLVNLIVLADVHMGGAIGVGTAERATAVALIWIGGMLFFGLGAILFRRM